MKRFLYFLTDRLQITYYERLGVLALGGAFVLLLTINQLYHPAPAFSEDYYQEIIADFHERVQARDNAHQEIMARYYPQSQQQISGSAYEHELNSGNASEKQSSDQLSLAAQPTASPAAAVRTEAATATATTMAAHAETSRASSTNTETALTPESRININTADAEELVKLPGIGPAIAARIIEYRNENGPFEDISEIKNVRGIGQARFEAIKDYITTQSDS
ncbi:MAG: helix-hairpin-helix domain-containing protein [Balneolales bacterium]|nr:helix-hairpin-helix domain-containing protein [Balneolales bacterium]